METVDIIAKGYEWVCPQCHTLNDIIEYPKNGEVTCTACAYLCKTSLPEHAYE